MDVRTDRVVRTAGLSIRGALLACAVLALDVACVSGPGRRGANGPAAQELVSRSRAALSELDWESARELASEATRLAPDSEPASRWEALLLDASSGPVPPGLRVPSGKGAPRSPSAPGPHVTAGALLYVGVPSLPLADTPASDAEATRLLPLNAAVTVLGVKGGQAHVRQVDVSALLTRRGQPRWSAALIDPEEPHPEGYVEARFLEPAPVDVVALRQRASTLLAAGSREEALTALAYVVFAEPWALEQARALHRLALELERIPDAAWAAWVISQGAQAPEPLEVLVMPVYGCRGDMHQAVMVEESKVGTEEDLALANACVEVSDLSPPESPVSLANCGDLTPTSEDYEDRVSSAHARMEEDSARYAEELKAYRARLAHLRQHHPEGPFLCASVKNPGQLSRWSVPVQLYAMPADEGECSTAGEVPSVEPLPIVGQLLLEGLRVPHVAPGATAEVCLKVPRYEHMFFGAVLAPDAQVATDFVRRFAVLNASMPVGWDSGDERQARLLEQFQAISAEHPHQEADTKFPLSCNLGCY